MRQIAIDARRIIIFLDKKRFQKYIKDKKELKKAD